MKKIFTLAIAAVMTLGAAAENWYAGGSLGFTRDIDNNITNLSVRPEVGYNFGEKWAVGTVLGYNHSYANGTRWNGFGVNPYVRYAFYKNEKVSIFCDGGFGLEFGKDNQAGSKTGINYEFGFKPGFAYAINDTFSLVAHVGFLGYQGSNDYGTNPEACGLNLDFNNVAFGFYVNF